MPCQFVKKLFTISSHKEEPKEETGSKEMPQPDQNENTDSPPPYTDISTGEKHVATSTTPDRTSLALSSPPNSTRTETLSSSNPSATENLSPPDPIPCLTPAIQICPHDTITFSRLKAIASLPNFDSPSKRIDALTSISSAHGRDPGITLKNQDQCVCWLLAREPPNPAFHSLHGYGSIYFRQTSSPGLLLSMHWYMKFKEDIDADTVEELKRYLERGNVRLCAHKRLMDPDILALVLSIACPKGARLADPIDRYLAAEGETKCPGCDTKVKLLMSKEGKKGFHLQVERYLGLGLRDDDPIWLAQCGV